MLKQGTPTKSEIHQLLRRYVLDTLEDFQCRIDLFGESRTEQAPDMLESLEFDLFESKLTMKDQQYTQHMGPVLDQLLAQMDRTIDRESGQHKLLCRELLKANIRVTEANMSRLKAPHQEIQPRTVLDDLGIEKESEPIAEPLNPPDPESGQQPAPSISLGTLIEEYKSRQIQSGLWSDVTVRNHGPKLNALLQFLGDRPVNQITIDGGREFAKVLELLPPRFAFFKEYEDIEPEGFTVKVRYHGRRKGFQFEVYDG